MDVNVLTMVKLFGQNIRYLIPEFQRPYVWNQEDQWEPLWDDVRNTAEEYIERECYSTETAISLSRCRRRPTETLWRQERLERGWSLMANSD